MRVKVMGLLRYYQIVSYYLVPLCLSSNPWWTLPGQHTSHLRNRLGLQKTLEGQCFQQTIESHHWWWEKTYRLNLLLTVLSQLPSIDWWLVSLRQMLFQLLAFHLELCWCRLRVRGASITQVFDLLFFRTCHLSSSEGFAHNLDNCSSWGWTQKKSSTPWWGWGGFSKGSLSLANFQLEGSRSLPNHVSSQFLEEEALWTWNWK